MNALSIFSGEMLSHMAQSDCEALLSLNELTAKHGLTLTRAEAVQLTQTKYRALSENSRIEIGVGALGRLAERFSRSGFISQSEWAATLSELCELFYFIKSDVHDRLSDNELIDFMFKDFEHYCGGSVDLLAGRCELIIMRANGSDVELDCVELDGEDEEEE